MDHIVLASSLYFSLRISRVVDTSHLKLMINSMLIVPNLRFLLTLYQILL